MGRLEYDSIHEPIVIDDETLAHLKIVMGTKLRRQESFMMTWLPKNSPDGRLTAWVHPGIPLLYAFDVAAVPKIDAERVELMMRELNATGELVLDHFLAGNPAPRTRSAR